jgi:hypothetical protein
MSHVSTSANSLGADLAFREPFSQQGIIGAQIQVDAEFGLPSGSSPRLRPRASND